MPLLRVALELSNESPLERSLDRVAVVTVSHVANRARRGHACHDRDAREGGSGPSTTAHAGDLDAFA
jgi:hypothetical protein